MVTPEMVSEGRRTHSPTGESDRGDVQNYSRDVETWSKKRKLFLVDLIILEVASVSGILLLLGSHGFGRDLTISIVLLVVCGTHLVLRLTYFKNIRSEVLEARRNRLPKL